MAKQDKAKDVEQAVKATPEEIEKGLALLASKRKRDATRKAKIEAGLIKPSQGKAYKDLTPEQKAKRLEYSTRRRVTMEMTFAKAKEFAPELIPTEAEVDEQIAKLQAVKAAGEAA